MLGERPAAIRNAERSRLAGEFAERGFDPS